jgi:hypothetical protein
MHLLEVFITGVSLIIIILQPKGINATYRIDMNLDPAAIVGAGLQFYPINQAENGLFWRLVLARNG